MTYAHAALAGFTAFVAGYTYSVSESSSAVRWWVPVLCGLLAVKYLVKLARGAGRPVSG